MLLDLREVIELPGGSVSFDYEPDLSMVTGGSVTGIKGEPRAVGYVSNKAGILTFSYELRAVLKCVCARCLNQFDYPLYESASVEITESGVGENPDGYCLEGNSINATEVIVTELIMKIDDRILCRDDCAGLCQSCGVDLNEKVCDCKKETDSRFEVLKQLIN